MDSLYAAGFFDGEGCFQICKNYQTKIVLTQKKPEVLYRFKAAYGGQVYRKAISRWQLSGREACKKFLETVIPHLIVKRADAELMLRMLELNSTNKTRPQASNGKYLPNPNNVEREEIYKAYKELRSY